MFLKLFLLLGTKNGVTSLPWSCWNVSGRWRNEEGISDFINSLINGTSGRELILILELIQKAIMLTHVIHLLASHWSLKSVIMGCKNLITLAQLGPTRLLLPIARFSRKLGFFFNELLSAFHGDTFSLSHLHILILT